MAKEFKIFRDPHKIHEEGKRTESIWYMKLFLPASRSHGPPHSGLEEPKFRGQTVDFSIVEPDTGGGPRNPGQGRLRL